MRSKWEAARNGTVEVRQALCSAQASVLYPGVENFRARYNELAYQNLDAETLSFVNTLWESLKIS